MQCLDLFCIVVGHCGHYLNRFVSLCDRCESSRIFFELLWVAVVRYSSLWLVFCCSKYWNMFRNEVCHNELWMIKTCIQSNTPWILDINSKKIKPSKDVLDIFWTSNEVTFNVSPPYHGYWTNIKMSMSLYFFTIRVLKIFVIVLLILFYFY